MIELKQVREVTYMGGVRNSHETKVKLPNGNTYTLCANRFYRYIGLNQYGQMCPTDDVKDLPSTTKYIAKVF